MRRRAFKVPHSKQRTYIERANQPVIIALKLSMPTSNKAFNRSSLKPYVAPYSSFDNPDPAQTHDETHPEKRHRRNASSIHSA